MIYLRTSRFFHKALTMHHKAHFGDNLTLIILINGLKNAFLVHLNLLHPLRIISAKYNFRRFNVDDARMACINWTYHITPMMNQSIQFKFFKYT